MGAAAVLETPAATPESIKFSANPSFCPDILVVFWFLNGLGVWSKNVLGFGLKKITEA